MNLFLEYHQELLKELLAGKVAFIVIGGYTVIFHGYKRTLCVRNPAYLSLKALDLGVSFPSKEK